MPRAVYSQVFFTGTFFGSGPLFIADDTNTIVVRQMTAFNFSSTPGLEGAFVEAIALYIDNGVLPYAELWQPGDGSPIGQTVYRWNGRSVIPPTWNLYATTGDINWRLNISGYRLTPT